MFSSVCVSSYVLCYASTPGLIGDVDMAASYAHHGVSYHKNQHKIMHARASMATCLVSGGEVLATDAAATSSSSELPGAAVAPNSVLEQQHRHFLNAMNEGDIGTIKQMITDDIQTTSMGKITSGRAAVEAALAGAMGMIKGNLTTGEGGQVESEVRTVSETETCSRYAANMMGMPLTLGGHIVWRDGKVQSSKSVMNPSGWDF